MSRRLKWLGFWTLLGVVSGVQLYFANQRLARAPDAWSRALEGALSFWYLWGLLSLVVAWLGRRFQVDRARFERHFFIHLGASLDLALLHVVAVAAVQNALYAIRGEPFPFTQRLIDTFTLFYHWDVLVYWAILAVVHALDYHRGLEERHAMAAALEAQLKALSGSPGEGVEPRGRRAFAERLLIADDGRSRFIRAADVEWFEAARNYVRLHSGGRAYVVRSTLTELEDQLDPGQFRRVSRSALVNVDRVREVQPWFHGDAVVILESGRRIRMSRRYRRTLLGAAAP